MSDISTQERAELLDLVESLMSGVGTEQEQDETLRRLKSRVPHPRVSDLIFWPQHEGFDRELTAEEVIEEALAYRPIEL